MIKVDNIIFRGFTEKGIILSSLEKPDIETVYPIFRTVDASFSDMIFTVENSNAVYDIVRKQCVDKIYFYTETFYPFICDLRKLFKGVAIFTTNDSTKYYSELGLFREVYVEDSFKDMVDVSLVEDSNDKILHYFIVDNPKAINMILNDNVDKENIMIQFTNTPMNFYEVIMNRNYDVIDESFNSSRDFVILNFKRKEKLKMCGDV